MKRFIILFIIFLTIAYPAYAEDWRKHSGSHFIIYYKNAPLDFVKTVLDAAEEYYSEITRNLGYTRYKSWMWDDRAQIYIYDDVDDYITTGKQVAWSHGTASPKDKVIRTFPAAHGFFDSTLPHELAHIIFREFVGFKADVPSWFEEGIAMSQEKAKRWGVDAIVRQALDEEKFISLRELSIMRLQRKSDPELIDLFYAESASVVNFLIKEYGEFRFVRFCRKLKDGKPFHFALDEVYVRMKNIDDLNDEWVEYLQR